MVFRSIFLMSVLFSVFVVAGCNRSSERVVGETDEWTFEDYKKARDAENAE